MLVIYLAGLVLIAAVSWAVASPFFEEEPAERGLPEAPAGSRWRKQKDEALAAIRDAEFDFHLGKLSETDYREMRRQLEARALEAMRALEGESRDHDR
ncbi:MAG: hypothetical protein ACREQ9_05080 [Candidatus Binatia bacterium]